MMFRHRARVGTRATLVAVMAFAGACTGGSTPSASPAAASGLPASPSESTPVVHLMGTATLTEDGCRLDGPGQVDVGLVRVVMVNEAGGQFDVDLWRLDAGHAYDEFAAHVADEMQRLQAGDPPLGHPAFADLVAEASAAAGSAADLDADLDRGTYAIACILLDARSVPSSFWSVGPIRVGE